MNFSTYAAFRFLRASREQRFISWITTLSIVGIAIGVATMIVVLSVINGFEDELRNRFLAANAHVMLYRFPAGLSSPEKWERSLQKQFGSEITGISPFVHAETMGRKEHLIHSVLVRGIDPEQRKRVQDLASIVRPVDALALLQDEIRAAEKGEPLPDAPSIILGIRLLETMNAKVGDLVELVAPQTESSGDPFRDMQKYKVVGVYDSGLQHYDVKLGILSIPAAQQLFQMGEAVTGLEIGLKDPDRSLEIAAELDMRYNLSVKEWQSYNRPIFEAMRTERLVIALIVALVAFVASFNILTTLFVTVTQKQREISLFKAIGASNGQILMLFLTQSSFIGFFGGALGILLALGLGFIIEHYQIVDLPDIYLLAKLPVEYDWRVYLGVTLGGVLIAALAGLYPAWSATRVTPNLGLMENV
ncbi:MAG: ABC transporter permease [Deltaproteobacteria bacterium]|nr:ABC transporter permease [Deltaproteobacteria bacterium]